MKKHIFPLCLIVLSLAAWLIVWGKLPSSLPIHWGWNGEVDKTASAVSVFFLMNGLLVVVYMLMIILPKIDPRKENYPGFTVAYHAVIDAIVMLFFSISLGTLAVGLGMDFNMSILIAMFLGILFVILGFAMPKFEQNYFIGVRTPWTISNKLVWEKTHKLAGDLYAMSGMITIFTMIFLSKYALIVMLILILASSIIASVYSYIIFSKLKHSE